MTSLNCTPQVMFPTGGDDVVVECFGNAVNNSILLLNTTTGLVDWTLAFANYSYLGLYDALDARAGSLFLLGARPSGPGSGGTPVPYLLTVDLSTRSLLRAVPFPSGATDLPLAFDEFSGRLLYFDYRNSTLREVDPTTGATARVVGENGSVQSIVASPDGQEAFVGVGSTTAGSYTQIVSLRTLGVVAYLPESSACRGLSDSSPDLIYLDGCGSLSEVNATTNQVVGTIVMPSGFGEPWSLVPAPGPVVLMAAQADSEVYVGEVQLAWTSVPGIAFAGVPNVGVALPWVFGLALVLAGSVDLAARGGRQLRPFLRYRRQKAEEEFRQLLGEAPLLGPARRP